MSYIATFHTHFGATQFNRTLSKAGKTGIMMPVPRVLSASCGVCIKFESTDNLVFENCADIDSVYRCNEGENDYTLIFSEE